ncbi:hypothetical protein F7R91_16860 [Streptomyces luteolifulvus]|uniref:L,D-transpeptidase n=1 Tax=Streptomyces luteolifulvus TaxID=2615112 RepID=A0A6H9V249_9ACTN|nr:L,D-transpeptidase [Streptomyces luteolifulvus]KAB1145992.1 hypothetical protein F7R91_16860 [Streptomyces luteolifulvus]
MSTGSAGFVAGLTAAALATVGVLAYQASASVPGSLGGGHERNSPAAAASKMPRDKRNPAALPAGSGTGRRVVYSLDDDRVWLVGAGNKVRRTFRVVPGSVDPRTGVHRVTSRSGAVTGTDGTPIEHVVRFTSRDGVHIGFSAAVGPPKEQVDPKVRTGGIRESRADGYAMWKFALVGEQVVVIR